MTVKGLRLHFHMSGGILPSEHLEGGRGMVVYLDGIIGLNFLIDWLLLLGVNRLAGYPPGAGRAAAAAAFGGGYTGLCMIPGFSFLASALWRTVSLGVMTMAAFGMNRSAWRRGMLFVLLSMALGGLALSLNHGGFLGLVAGAGGLALLCIMGFAGRSPGKRLIPVTMEHEGRAISFLALLDTGNTLKDPVTGEPIVIAGPRAARELLGLEAWQLRDPVQTMTAMGREKLRLIPYHTVGTDRGFLLGLRCDRVEYDGKTGRKMVAFSGEDFPGGEYEGLIGGV